MKTAAAIILLLALVGMYPKHKNKEKRAAGMPPAAVYDIQAPSPDIVNRIVRHARAIRPRSGQSDEELTLIAENIVKYAAAYGIEPELGAALIARESAYNPRAVSSAGACGLGQMMPGTAAKMGARDCHDIEQGARGAMAYMRSMLDMWAGKDMQVDCALASYLTGPRNVRCDSSLWQSANYSRYLKGIYEYRNDIKAYR